MEKAIAHDDAPTDDAQLQAEIDRMQRELDRILERIREDQREIEQLREETRATLLRLQTPA